jgi:hypothetical protein
MNNNAEDYAAHIAAFRRYGLELYVERTGGGCVALALKLPDVTLYTLGPFFDDRYQGFEAMGEDGNSVAYEPPGGVSEERSVEEEVDLIAPALLRYASGDLTPLLGWTTRTHTNPQPGVRIVALASCSKTLPLRGQSRGARLVYFSPDLLRPV